MYIMALQAVPNSNFLISNKQFRKHDGRTNFWGGKDTRATLMYDPEIMLFQETLKNMQRLLMSHFGDCDY